MTLPYARVILSHSPCSHICASEKRNTHITYLFNLKFMLICIFFSLLSTEKRRRKKVKGRKRKEKLAQSDRVYSKSDQHREREDPGATHTHFMRSFFSSIVTVRLLSVLENNREKKISIQIKCVFPSTLYNNRKKKSHSYNELIVESRLHLLVPSDISFLLFCIRRNRRQTIPSIECVCHTHTQSGCASFTQSAQSNPFFISNSHD